MSEHFTPGGPYSTGGTATAANLNNMETGIQAVDNAKVDADGTTAITGTQDLNQTLGGADKTFLTITATDGKQYAIKERNSDKALVIRNVTDSVDLLVIGPTVANGNMLTFGTGGQKTGFKDTMGSTLPVSGMVKGDRHTLTPFSLP